MRAAPAAYDPQYIQELVKRVDAIELRFGMPLDKITLRASDDATNIRLKDITVNIANTITAVDAT
jgi:hypothetical protein